MEISINLEPLELWKYIHRRGFHETHRKTLCWLGLFSPRECIPSTYRWYLIFKYQGHTSPQWTQVLFWQICKSLLVSGFSEVPCLLKYGCPLDLTSLNVMLHCQSGQLSGAVWAPGPIVAGMVLGGVGGKWMLTCVIICLFVTRHRALPPPEWI